MTAQTMLLAFMAWRVVVLENAVRKICGLLGIPLDIIAGQAKDGNITMSKNQAYVTKDIAENANLILPSERD